MAVYTQTMYDALVEAISLGADEVWYGDKRVKYRTLAEMRALKEEMELDLGLKQNNKRKYGDFTKGIC